jgi:putative hydrolase of the HAD superfamily
MRAKFNVIAFDADDTLWHNETLYSTTQEKFQQLLARYQGADLALEKLYATEMRNLEIFGYGIKGFTLSMIETAIELTQGRIEGREIQQIIDLAREMRRAPVQLLDHVADILPPLAETHMLMLVTKGDLFDQETKIAQSGLADHFAHIEIVSDKRQDTYEALLRKHHITPEGFLMVGNSLRSDILPVIAIGGAAAYIPYHLTWAHETVIVAGEQQYFELEHIGMLPDLLDQLYRSAAADNR